jgi:hypothetical protein
MKNKGQRCDKDVEATGHYKPWAATRAEALGGSLYSDRAGEVAWPSSLLVVDQIY